MVRLKGEASSIEGPPIAQSPREAFADFYKSFQTPIGIFKYREHIRRMASLNQRSLTIDFEDLLSFNPSLAKGLIEKPREYIEYASKAVMDVMRIENLEYANKIPYFHARFRRMLEAISLRKLRVEHLNKLVMIEGVVTRATLVKQQIVEAAYECQQCGEKTSILQASSLQTYPTQCSNPSCGRRGLFKFIPEESRFIDWQKLTLQEKPEELPPGQIPREIDLIVKEDLVDVARPGDRVSVVGVVEPRQEYSRAGRLTTFSAYIEGNCIDVSEKGVEEVEVTPEEEQRILELAKDPFIHQNIIKSIAPSIYGLEEVKEAIAYQLFGGVPKVMPDGVRIRGDANILLIGDPGTGKSQVLQYIAQLAPRGLYTTGKGSTAAGLTATVARDRVTGEYYLEAGALVLADGGIACIDEIDKMRPEDRVAIHEAMEQHTISITKAGIAATLNARTAILAAANPAFGRYIPQRSVAENISPSLPVTILSRFDLIFILQDKPEAEKDRDMAEHVTRLHEAKAPAIEPPIPPELLKKYLCYARRNVMPKLTPEAAQRLKEFYLSMRLKGESPDSPVPLTLRQLESSIRLAEARARMALRPEVTVEDAEAAIRLVHYCLRQVSLDKTTGQLDIDIITVGRAKSQQDKMAELMEVLMDMEKEFHGPVDREEFIKRAEGKGFDRIFVERTLRQWKIEGTIFEPKPSQTIKRA